MCQKGKWRVDKLKKDNSIMILPADQGLVTVVFNKKEYEENCQQMLEMKNIQES